MSRTPVEASGGHGPPTAVDPEGAQGRAGSSAAPDSVGRLVMLAYHFPPQIGIASERAASFARWLPQWGWDVDVVTVAEGGFPRIEGPPLANASTPGASAGLGAPRSVTALDASAPSVRVRATRAFDPSRLVRRRIATSVELREERALTLRPGADRLRTWARRWLYVPDSKVGWVPWARVAAHGALADATRVLGAGRTVLMSSSVPYSAHLAAWASLREGVPWVAEFRDPWSEASPSLRSSSPLRRAVDERLHRAVLARADRIVVTTHASADRLVRERGVSRERVRVIHNGFEPGPLGSPPLPTEPLRLVYAGTVAPGEDTEPLLRALGELAVPGRSPVVLRVVGPAEPWASVARRVGAEGVLDCRGTTSPEGARQEMADASANLLLNLHPAYRDIVPGKAFEYLGAGRPILAAIPAGTELHGLLVGHAALHHLTANRPGAWRRLLLELADAHRGGDLRGPERSAALEPLTRQSRTSQLAALLEELVSLPSGGTASAVSNAV